MSASRSSRSSRLSLASKKMKKPSPAVVAARAPWIFDGIDYGPARAAVRDLANWALDIADRAVDDWPVAQAHVRNTRRFVSSRIEGKKLRRRVSIDDVLFTAELLARIFDEDLGLGLSEALTILETLDLPLDAVPMPRRAPRVPMLVPLRATLQSLANSAMPTRAAPVAPLRFCDDCGYVHEPSDHVRHRNAA